MNGLKTAGLNMNGSRVVSRIRNLASIAILFGAVLAISALPAHAQQEIDPTWYDPMPVTAAVHSAPVAQSTTAAPVLHAVVTHRYLSATDAVSESAKSGNAHAKQIQSGRNASVVAKNNQPLAADNKLTLLASNK